MSTQTHVSRILAYEVMGFLAIITLSWGHELTEIPRILGGIGYIHNWRESVLETLIVLLAAMPVMIFTKRLVSRLYHLEGFLRVCAWCGKLEHNGEWIALEEFFESKFQTETSHGMCQVCFDDLRAKRKNAFAA
jgi:hypothetical protein